MPVQFNIPFIPQTAISDQILQALKQGYDERQRGQELEQRKVEETRRQQQADAQINLEAARQRLLEAQERRDKELDPTRKLVLETDLKMKQFELKDAESKAKFFLTDQLPLAPGESGFDLFAKAQRQQIEQGGKMTPEEEAEFTSAVAASKQKRDVTMMHTVAKDIRATRAKPEPMTVFRSWHDAFVKEKGREPSAAEVQSFQTASTQLRINAQAGGATATEIADTAEAVATGQMEITAVPMSIRPAVVSTIKESGRLIVSAKERGDIQALDIPLAIIADISKYADRVNVKEGVSARTGGAARQTAAFFGLDPDVTLLQSKIGTLALIIRALGEKGTLNEGDMTRAISLIPGVRDTKTEKDYKIHDLIALLKEVKATKTRGTAQTFGREQAPPEAQAEADAFMRKQKP